MPHCARAHFVEIAYQSADDLAIFLICDFEIFIVFLQVGFALYRILSPAIEKSDLDYADACEEMDEREQRSPFYYMNPSLKLTSEGNFFVYLKTNGMRYLQLSILIDGYYNTRGRHKPRDD